jgi:bacterioferritin
VPPDATIGAYGGPFYGRPSLSGEERDKDMKGDQKVIGYLNEALKAELTAINQYFLHAEMMENWGYKKLAALTRKESIEEMRHAEALIERILFLDGSPVMDQLFPLRIGQNIKSQFQNDLALELEAVPRLNRAINAAVEAADNGSRDLFESILTDEEEHVDFLEAQLHMIEEMGYDNYLAQQVEE